MSNEEAVPHPDDDADIEALLLLRPGRGVPLREDDPRLLHGTGATPGKVPVKLRAPDLLAAAADTFRQRNALYGDNYTRFGDIMMGIFPAGVELRTAADFNRYGQLFMCMCKLTRYAENFNKGGHQDSAHDLTVYAAMLEEMTK